MGKVRVIKAYQLSSRHILVSYQIRVGYEAIGGVIYSADGSKAFGILPGPYSMDFNLWQDAARKYRELFPSFKPAFQNGLEVVMSETKMPDGIRVPPMKPPASGAVCACCGGVKLRPFFASDNVICNECLTVFSPKGDAVFDDDDWFS